MDSTEANVPPPAPSLVKGNSTIVDEKESPSVPITPKDEKQHPGTSDEFSDDAPISCTYDQKLALKIDFHVLLPMLFLNFFSLMGRTNIGTALIQKLPQDLKLNAMDVVIAVSLAFVPLIVLEIPSNILMRTLENNVGLPYIKYLSIITGLLGGYYILSFAKYSKPRAL